VWYNWLERKATTKHGVHSENISVDFSSEADAKKSIEDIVKKLKSEPYQEYARIANEYLSKQDNINKSN
jgi:hypothetical protein